MNTGDFIKAEAIIFNSAAMAGDREYKLLPKGFYLSLIMDAFSELNMLSGFSEMRKNYNFPENLTLNLPDDCFDILNVYVFNGDNCNISNSRKVYWKRNYYTQGGAGYIANDKGKNNSNDPFYAQRSLANNDKSLIRIEKNVSVNNVLFYNLQMGNIMFSSSCKQAGAKVHIHYRGTGSKAVEEPIIPILFKQAIEDYVTEAAIRVRLASEPSMIRVLMPMQQLYERRLDKEGMNGSWFSAKQRVKDMNKGQREDLAEYLGRGAWASGF